MSSLYGFADVQSAVVDYLDAKFTDATTVSTWFPSGDNASASVPHVQVIDGGAPTIRYPVWQRHSIRITAWHLDQPRAYILFQRAQAYLATFTGNGDIWSCFPATGPLRTTDPDTDPPLALCSGTFTVSARPVVLTP
jgi:hypothetical protein